MLANAFLGTRSNAVIVPLSRTWVGTTIKRFRRATGPNDLALARYIAYDAAGGPRMNRIPRVLFFFSVLVVTFTLVGASSASPAPMPTQTIAHDAAVISNPGSGDYAGFLIVVEPNGRAQAVDGAGRASSELQQNIVQTFFADLADAGRLDKLPTGGCSTANSGEPSTSVEVNAPIVITWSGQHTGALACVTDPRAIKILLDATTIQRALYVQAYRKRVTVGYGTGYSASGYQRNTGYDNSHFYIPRFQNDAFTFTNFSTGGFYFSNFDSGLERSRGPWSSLPSSTQVFTNLPYSSPFSGLPSGNIPVASPYSSAPYTSLGSVSSFGAGPYSSGPFSNSGPTVVTHP